jgi:hypothetical protein
MKILIEQGQNGTQLTRDDAMRAKKSTLFEIALVLVCFDHVASVLIDADDSVM